MIKVKKKKFEEYKNNVIFKGRNQATNMASALKLRKPAENNFFGPTSTTTAYNTSSAANGVQLLNVNKIRIPQKASNSPISSVQYRDDPNCSIDMIQAFSPVMANQNKVSMF